VEAEKQHDDARPDIVIQTKRLLVFIENKINLSAFSPDQIHRHARSGDRKSRIGGQKFYLVLLLPEKNQRAPALAGLEKKCGARVIGWEDIVRLFARVRRKYSKGKAPGIPFIDAYLDFIERTVLHMWRGFEMIRMDTDTIRSVAHYVSRKKEIRQEFVVFYKAVNLELGKVPRGVIGPRVEHEQDWREDGTGLLLFDQYYELRIRGVTAYVTLYFLARPGAGSIRDIQLWLDFSVPSTNGATRLRRAGVLAATKLRRAFGATAEVYVAEGWVGEKIPYSKWQASGSRGRTEGVAYIGRRLRQYLVGAAALR